MTRVCRICGGVGSLDYGSSDVISCPECLEDENDRLRAELQDLAERATELEKHAERYWRRDGAPRPWAIETHRLWRPWHEVEK